MDIFHVDLKEELGHDLGAPIQGDALLPSEL
jgi:hypothetical protein